MDIEINKLAAVAVCYGLSLASSTQRYLHNVSVSIQFSNKISAKSSLHIAVEFQQLLQAFCESGPILCKVIKAISVIHFGC